MRIREATIADARGIAAVHVASWRTTYRGVVPDEYLANLSVDAREQNWVRQIATASDQTAIYVAEEEARADGDEVGRIVGFAAGGPRREGNAAYAGKLYAIYLLEEAQGHGLGRQLVHAVAERLAPHGITSMLVWALEANPACRFYEALGGVLLPERQYFERAGVRLAEVSYGWGDTGALMKSN